jgi:hypothetical protein
MAGDLMGIPEILPRVNEQVELRDATAGFSYVTEPENAFVMPTLRSAVEGAPAPSVVLVEARAAVGKSMLARHLAWGTGAPLWDLSQVYVGSGTLWGSLAKAFGPMQLNSVIGRMLTGEFVLIIDALDEAEMHASGEAFDAFLIELRDMFAAPRSAPGVVILGRSETIEYVDLFLAGQIPVSRYRILDFDEDQARQFVDNRLDYGPISEPMFAPGAHRKRESMYVDARDRLFSFLSDRIVPDHEPRGETSTADAGGGTARTDEWSARIRSFLGYAPVLETIAEYLASYAATYHALISDLERMESNPYHSGNAQWDMLATIVDQLLRREQGKVTAQLSKVVATTNEIDWSQVYTPDEQCGYVLGRVAGSQELLGYIPAIPADAKARYREVLQNALPNHPFLGSFSGYANVVFRDYVHAWGLLSAKTAPLDAVRNALHAEEYLPSPLLGPFVIAGNLALGRRAAVAGEDFGFVYESLLTQGENRLVIHREQGEPADVFIGDDRYADLVILEITRPEDGVRFWRRLERASIRGEVTLQLGLPGHSFALGPDVTLEVGIVEVPCRSIRIYTKDGGVTMTASAGYVGPTPEVELRKFGGGEFNIWWEGARYPWIEFAKKVESARGPGTRQWGPADDAYLNLSQVVRDFIRGHGIPRYWGPVVFSSGHVLYQRTRKNLRLGLMINWLISLDIIVPSIQRESYYLDSARFREYGITLSEILGRQETPEMQTFVELFLEYAS